MNLMDVDEIDESLPNTPDPVIFDQTVTEVGFANNAMEPK